MSTLPDLIGRRFEEWGGAPAAVHAAFDDTSEAAVAVGLETFCLEQLGSAIARPEFFAVSVGVVCGARLRDGRRVVVKVHPPTVGIDFLNATAAVKGHLRDRGFPAPRRLAGPVRVGRGLAEAEELVDAGRHADAHRPQIREALAAALATLVSLARPFTALPGLGARVSASPTGGLWPIPHDGRFDFPASSTGAEWIDRIATRAREVCDRPVGSLVVGHTDWRAENVRVLDGRVSAVYDWDSLRVEREPVIVGSAAHGFTTNWAVGQSRQFPTRAEALSFIAGYERARGRPFTTDELGTARAALVYAMAYAARCEHSDAVAQSGWPQATSSVPPSTARGFLATHASGLLGRHAGAA